MAIQSTSENPLSEPGGDHNMTVVAAVGIAAATIQERRRPRFALVRSERYPAMGSEIASQIRPTPKRTPIAAGAMSRTSVLNFMR